MSEMIRLENVTFGYDEGQTVLKDYSLKINQGEFVTILGHNGSGKSTLSKLLVGLIEAQAGKIFVDGQPLNEETVFEIRQKIGIVFQNPDISSLEVLCATILHLALKISAYRMKK